MWFVTKQICSVMQLHNIFNILLGVLFNNQILNPDSQNTTQSICITARDQLKYILFFFFRMRRRVWLQ